MAEASDAAYSDKSRAEVTFYNIVFDAHEVFCANGLPVESFLPSKKVLKLIPDEARKTLKELFPDLGTPQSEYAPAPYAAPEPESYRPEFV